MRSPGAGRRVVGAVAGALLAGVLAAGCAGAGETGTLSQRVRSWVSASAMGSDVGTVVGDIRSVDEVERLHRGVDALHTVCSALSIDAEAGNQELPAPVTALTDSLSSGYQLAYNAGNACYDGAGGNAALLARSATDRARAVVLFDRAVAEVRATSGMSVSTTTTTTPGGNSGIGGELF